jgi:flagellar protein FliS
VANFYTKRYEAIQVESASPEYLVVVAYEGLLRFLHQAKFALLKQDVERAHWALMKSQLLIGELANSLRLELWNGAFSLLRLYDFFLEKIKEANLEKRVEPLDEILPLVQSLVDAWREAYRKIQSEKNSVEVSQTFGFSQNFG